MTQTKTQTNTSPKVTFNHNVILGQPTFALRGAAIAKRLEDIKSSPKYKALPEEKKAKVRADVYEKFVPQSYEKFHLGIPDKDTWVAATGRDTAINHYEKSLNPTKVGWSKSYNELKNDEEREDFAAGFHRAAAGIALFGARLGNAAFLSTVGMASYFSPTIGMRAAVAYNKSDIEKRFANDENALYHKMQDDTFFLETHPRDTMVGKLASITGETVATLPLYEAIGEAGIIGRASKAMPLTQVLEKSPVGKFVAKRLLNATDGFLTSLIQSGGDSSQAKMGAVAVAGLGTAGEVAGATATKIASQPLIKKWLANVIAVGGKPLAEELVHSAHAEEEFEILHAVDHSAEASTGTGLDRTKQVESGERPQIIRDWYAKQQLRSIEDPVMHKLHEAAKKSTNSLALAMYNKPLRGLSKNQRLKVVAKHLSLIPQAAEEAPALLQDLQANDVESGLEAARKASPELNATMSKYEKLGINFAPAVTANQVASIERETGISSVQGATRKIRKATKELSSGGEEITPERFVSLNADSIAFMRAPRNRTAFAVTISDRSKEGANKFIDLLKKSSPGNVLFENPQHLMLYHYSNRAELPAGITSTLRYRLRQTQGFENATSEQLAREATEVKRHFKELAFTGHLKTEGNFFRSTKTNGPVAQTIWQHQLTDEVIDKYAAPISRSLKNHPEQKKGFESAIALLKAGRPKIKTPDEYNAYIEVVKNYTDSAKSKIKQAKQTGMPFQF